MTILETAINICAQIEPKLREVGYHCALTGSVLYGLPKKQCQDIDILIYSHDTESAHLRKPVDFVRVKILLQQFFPNIKNPAEDTDYPAFVLKAYTISGVSVDFLIN